MYSRLLSKCYSVLYNQTMLWILHGKLFDKFDEYFIYKLVNTKENKDRKQSDMYNEFE